MNEYERRRLENIRRNDEMMAALKLHSTAASLLSKRPRVTAKSEKKPKTKTSLDTVVIRRSLRTRGISPPHSKGLKKAKTLPVITHKSTPMSDAYRGDHCDSSFIESFVAMTKKESPQSLSRSLTQEPMNEYERRRLENIRRNAEMMAALKLHSTAASLVSKRPRVTNKSEKKRTTLDTAVIRRSLRTSGISQPHSKGLQTLPAITQKSIPMSDAYRGHHSDQSFIESFVAMAKKESPHHVTGDVDGGGAKGGFFEGRKRGDKVTASFEVVGSMELDPKNILKVVSEKINVVRFIPSSNLKMILAGTHLGNIRLWNVEDDEGRVYLYHPHRAIINGVSVHPHCLSKIYTSCYDGSVWLMDVEKETFDLVFSFNEHIYNLQQPKDELNSLYFSRGRGVVTVWDQRMGKCSSHWVLHEDRINTIDFNPENPHIVATSSSDGTVCTWDLRYADGDNITALKTLTHKSSVQSAYFSPSGCRLATTSLNNTIGIYGGVNLEDATIIYDNQSRSYLSQFRSIWGWDDSYVFGGNTRREVDVVSAVERKIVKTLKSPHVSAVVSRFDAHPCEVGTLAGATVGGQVYVWTSR